MRLLTSSQRPLHAVDVAVLHHREPRPRQPAGIDQGGVVALVGDDEDARPSECADGRQIGEVSGGEDKGVRGTEERGETLFEIGMERGGAGDQPRTGRARPPHERGSRRRRDNPRIAGQPEVVVAREVDEAVAAGRPWPQLARDTVERPQLRGVTESLQRVAHRAGSSGKPCETQRIIPSPPRCVPCVDWRRGCCTSTAYVVDGLRWTSRSMTTVAEVGRCGPSHAPAVSQIGRSEG
jgi:hypothetical protein